MNFKLHFLYSFNQCCNEILIYKAHDNFGFALLHIGHIVYSKTGIPLGVEIDIIPEG